MPAEEPPIMETHEHTVDHDIQASEQTSHEAEGAAGAFATSDGHVGPGGTSVVDGAIGAGASSADRIPPEDDSGAPFHEPAPPHTGTAGFPDPPQP
jgi:hypothetical protein